jgi:hypothetical protein
VDPFGQAAGKQDDTTASAATTQGNATPQTPTARPAAKNTRGVVRQPLTSTPNDPFLELQLQQQQALSEFEGGGEKTLTDTAPPPAAPATNNTATDMKVALLENRLAEQERKTTESKIDTLTREIEKLKEAVRKAEEEKAKLGTCCTMTPTCICMLCCQKRLFARRSPSLLDLAVHGRKRPRTFSATANDYEPNRPKKYIKQTPRSRKLVAQLRKTVFIKKEQPRWENAEDKCDPLH